MTLSKEQLDYQKLRYRKWFWIWERDLMWLARQFSAWRDKAHELGFNDEKIGSVWIHDDAGAQIKYMENPWFELPASASD